MPSYDECWVCGFKGVTYAMFSGGREFWCPKCDTNHPYKDGTEPPRVKLLQTEEGREELRKQMAEHFKADTDEGPSPMEGGKYV